MKLKAKVCGLTNADDARLALHMGADFVGFVHHPPSPRHCGDIPSASANAGGKGVLVIVGEEAGPMIALARAAGLTWIQPHSRDRKAALVQDLRGAGFKVLLPWPDEGGQEPIKAELYLWEPNPKRTGVPGGSGQAHEALHPPPGPYLLAGGLDAENLQRRLAILPLVTKSLLRGVDAASRLEAGPGRKDPVKVQAYLENAHALHL
ncbi:MAG: phosphoribosylanthranilate isomerase [Acidobacteria bacterium]|nr:phosphoribosylanthranilate isomerase [Acidobacteriota bacterium]